MQPFFLAPRKPAVDTAQDNWQQQSVEQKGRVPLDRRSDTS
jgi:hypothetical protein